MHVKAIIGTLSLLAAVAGQAAAEEAQTEARPEVSGLGIEEIVVTAEGREQTVQDVPVSITAITAKQREDMGIITISDLANFTPGFTYGPGDRPSIRGVGRLSNNLSVENAIATYADGAWTNSVAEAGKDPIFVDRSEILRGPQGTLYGRNAIGGAINVISKRPSDDFEAEARVTLYNADGSTLQGSVSGPITDKLRYRFAASQPRNEGFDHNVATHNNLGKLDLWYAEGQIEWDITDSLQLWAVYRTSKWDDDALYGYYNTGAYVTNREFTVGSLGPAAAFGFSQPGYTQIGTTTTQPGTHDPWEKNQSSRSSRNLDDVDIGGLHLDWLLDSYSLHYVYGGQQYYYQQITDFDGSPVTSYTQPGGQYFAPLELPATVFPSYTLDYVEDKKWYSHELSIKSAGDGALQWIAGIYYFHDEFDQPLSVNMPDQAQLATPTYNFFCGFVNVPGNCLGGAPFFFPWDPSPPAAPLNPTRSIFYADQQADNDSYAGYAQIDWDVTDTWQVTLGLRRTKDEKNVDESTRLLCFGNLSFGCTPINGVPLIGYVTQANDVTTQFRPASGVTPGPTWTVVGAPGVASNPVTDPVTGLRSRKLEDDWEQTTGTAGIQFRPNENALGYLRYSRGYKAGGLNAGNLTAFPEASEETINAYEIGWKQTFGDTFQIYSTAFFYDWNDMQVPLTVIQVGASREDLINLSSVEIYGAEFETQWQPIDNLFLMTSYAYLNTEIQDGCCYVNPVDPEAVLPTASRAVFDPVSLAWTQDIAGNPLPQSPEHRVTFNASYNFNFNAGTLILSGTYIWRDEAYNDIFNTREAVAPDWDQVDLRVVWRAASDKYTLIGFARNVGDEEIYTAASATRTITGPVPNGVGGFLVGAPSRIDKSFNLGAPRTYGIEVHYRFRAGS